MARSKRIPFIAVGFLVVIGLAWWVATGQRPIAPHAFDAEPDAGEPVMAAEPPTTRPALDRPLLAAESRTDGDDDQDDEAPVTAPGTESVTVIVQSTDQAPLAGIPVVLLLGDAAPHAADAVRWTDRTGRARFAIDSSFTEPLEAIAAARTIPGSARFVPLRVVPGAAVDATIILDAGSTLAIHALDPDGAAWRGRLRARRVLVDEPPPETGPKGTLLTAGFGDAVPHATRHGDSWWLPGFRAAEDVVLNVAAAGFEPVFVKTHVPEKGRGPHPVEAKLTTRVAQVIVELLPPRDAKADALRYSCRPLESGDLLLALGGDDRPAQGSPRFVVDILPAHAQRLRAAAWRDGRLEAAAEFDVPAIPAGEKHDAGRVKLDPVNVLIAGTVSDDRGHPLGGATIEAMSRAGGGDLAAQTTDDGTFEIRGIAGHGPFEIGVHVEGRVSEQVLNVSEGTRDLRIALESAGGIAGRVALPAGIPAAKVGVKVVGDRRGKAASSLRSDGSFVIGGLPAGRYAVTIEGPGVQPVRVADVVVAPPELNRDPRLERVLLAPTAAPPK